MESPSTNPPNGEQRLHALNELTKCVVGAPTALEACSRTATVLTTCASDLRFTLLYVVEPDLTLTLAAASGLTPADKTALGAAPGGALALWNVGNSACGAVETVELDERHHRLVPSLASCRWAHVLPIRGAVCRSPAGFLVAGLCSARTLDEGSREFLQLLASAIGSSLAGCRAAEAERAHEQLIGEIEQSTSTFFSYIGHELRTPLHAILGWAQVLNQNGVAAPQLARGLEAIERNARAQNEMVNNLIALRRRMAGQGRVEPATLATVVPAAVADVPTASANQERSPRELDGLTVLVVEDNADGLDVVREVLSTAGAQVLTAGSSEEGLTMLERHRADLIVSDLGLPGADGYAFIQQVRSRDESAGGTTPALALSALAQSADRERALRSGFQMHLAKPVEQSELVTVCASLTGRLG